MRFVRSHTQYLVERTADLADTARHEPRIVPKGTYYVS